MIVNEGIKATKSPTTGIAKKYLDHFAKMYRESAFFAHVFPSYSSGEPSCEKGSLSAIYERRISKRDERK